MRHRLLLFWVQFGRFQGISKLKKKLGFLKRKTVLAVVFVLTASFFNLIFFGYFQQPTAGAVRLGGPAETEAFISLESSPAALEVISGPVELVNPVTKELVLAIPTAGRNWGELHDGNAVDIASRCGNPIYAAAAGLVAESSIGWNHGYGNLVVLDHSNGISTAYAHNQKNLVEAGQYVAAGEKIALVGRTGNVIGETGCHVHFKPVGINNPFVWR